MDQNNIPNNGAPQQPQQPQQPTPPPYQPPYYQAPQAPHQFNPEATPKFVNNLGKGGGWIGFVRVCAWIMFGIIELAVIIAGFGMIISGFGNMRWGGGMLILFGFITLIVGTFCAFLIIASTMITLDQAKNIQRIASSTAELNSKVEDLAKKIK